MSLPTEYPGCLAYGPTSGFTIVPCEEVGPCLAKFSWDVGLDRNRVFVMAEGHPPATRRAE